MNFGDLRRDVVVVADITVVLRDTTNITGEAFAAGDELGVDNCLNLDLTDLFSDDLLVVLPDDSKLLLDNLNALGVADNFFFLD